MKYFFIYFFLALALVGCNYFYDQIEFNGKTPGLTGNVIIKDLSGNVVYGAFIKNGKFHIKQQSMAKPGTGYYQLLLPGNDSPFEIYLEPTVYTIATRKPGLIRYPLINSSSKIQNELSAYYRMADSIKYTTHQEMTKLIAQMNSTASQLLSPDIYKQLVESVKKAQVADNMAASAVIVAFMKRHPQNAIMAHLMVNMDYSTNPQKYYKIYQTFSKAAAQSDEGHEIGEKLKDLVKLVPGKTAPKLLGKTPDGKTIELIAMHKKVILIEFWKADITIARKNHTEILNGLLPQLGDQGFGIVSVSFDQKRDWWISSIKEDKMTWLQVNDLQGFDSPNVKNWGISSIPMYSVLDGQGRIIIRDIPFDNVIFTVKNYLEIGTKH